MSATIVLVAALGVALVVFAVLEGTYGWRARASSAHLRTDLAYLVSDLTLSFLVTALRVAIPAGLTWLVGRAWHGPLADMGTAAQLAIGALILEFGIWFMHWAWHRFDVLYPFHAVHHGSTEVYFLSGLRQHPVQFLADQLFFAFLLAAAGVRPELTVFLSVFQLVMTFFTHANLDVRFPAPLKFLLASPRFHVLHHDATGKGALKNLGGGLAIFDWAFGTAADPDRVEAPASLGSGPDFPASYRAQLVFPFRRGETS